MLPIFNAIILDVVVVLLLILTIVAGVLKGIKHTLVNFSLLLGAIALSFTSFLNVVKLPLIDLFDEFMVLGAGSSKEARLALSFLYSFLASLTLTILFYLVFRLLKTLIVGLSHKKSRENNELIVEIKPVSRVFGGIFSCILYGIVIVVSLTIFNNPLVGGNKTMENSYVARYIDMGDEVVVDLINKEFANKYENILIIGMIRGDLYSKISEDDLNDIDVIVELVDEGKIVIDNLNNVDNSLKYMRHLMNFVMNNFIDEEGKVLEEFEASVQESRDLVTAGVNQINSLHKAEHRLEADKTLAFVNMLRKFGLVDVALTFENIFVIK